MIVPAACILVAALYIAAVVTWERYGPLIREVLRNAAGYMDSERD